MPRKTYDIEIRKVSSTGPWTVQEGGFFSEELAWQYLHREYQCDDNWDNFESRVVPHTEVEDHA